MPVAAATETPLVPKWETIVDVGIPKIFPSFTFFNPEAFKFHIKNKIIENQKKRNRDSHFLGIFRKLPRPNQKIKQKKRLRPNWIWNRQIKWGGRYNLRSEFPRKPSWQPFLISSGVVILPTGFETREEMNLLDRWFGQLKRAAKGECHQFLSQVHPPPPLN